MCKCSINSFRFRQFSHFYATENGFNYSILVSFKLVSNIICNMAIFFQRIAE